MFPASVYQSVFDRSPVGEYLLSASDDPTILAVNDAFLKAAARKREELVAQRLFAAFQAIPKIEAIPGSQHCANPFSA